jgi:hypothetical protein
MFRPKFFFTALAAVLAVVLAPTTSQADFTITVQDGSNFASIGSTALNQATVSTLSGYSNTGGVEQLVASNLTVADASGGFYSIAITLARTNTPGGPSSYLTLNSLFVSYSGPGTGGNLVVSTTATGFNLPVSPVIATTNYSGNFLAGSRNGSATYMSSIDGQTIVDQTYGYNQSANNESGSLTTGYTGTFSLTDQVIVSGLTNTDAFQSGSLSTNVVSTPAPSGLVLLASCLPFAALLRLRKRDLATVA